MVADISSFGNIRFLCTGCYAQGAMHTSAEWKEAAELPAPGAASRRRNRSQLYEAGWHHEAFVPDRIGKISGQGFFLCAVQSLGSIPLKRCTEAV